MADFVVSSLIHVYDENHWIAFQFQIHQLGESAPTLNLDQPGSRGGKADNPGPKHGIDLDEHFQVLERFFQMNLKKRSKIHLTDLMMNSEAQLEPNLYGCWIFSLWIQEEFVPLGCCWNVENMLEGTAHGHEVAQQYQGKVSLMW